MAHFAEAKKAVEGEYLKQSKKSKPSHPILESGEELARLKLFISAAIDAYLNSLKGKEISEARRRISGEIEAILNNQKTSISQKISFIQALFGANYHRGILKRSYYEDCVNAAIYLYQSNEFQSDPIQTVTLSHVIKNYKALHAKGYQFSKEDNKFFDDVLGPYAGRTAKNNPLTSTELTQEVDLPLNLSKGVMNTFRILANRTVSTAAAQLAYQAMKSRRFKPSNDNEQQFVDDLEKTTAPTIPIPNKLSFKFKEAIYKESKMTVSKAKPYKAQITYTLGDYFCFAIKKYFDQSGISQTNVKSSEDRDAEKSNDEFEDFIASLGGETYQTRKVLIEKHLETVSRVTQQAFFSLMDFVCKSNENSSDAEYISLAIDFIITWQHKLSEKDLINVILRSIDNWKNKTSNENIIYIINFLLEENNQFKGKFTAQEFLFLMDNVVERNISEKERINSEYNFINKRKSKLSENEFIKVIYHFINKWKKKIPDQELINLVDSWFNRNSALRSNCLEAIKQFITMQDQLESKNSEENIEEDIKDGKNEIPITEAKSGKENIQAPVTKDKIPKQQVAESNKKPFPSKIELTRNLVGKHWVPDDAPNSNRRVILAVHGLGDSVETWEGQVQAWLAMGFEVISYDQAGHGFDELRKQDKSLNLTQMQYDFYQQLQSLEDNASIGEIQVVGHSLGGAMLLNSMATIENTSKVTRATCISPAMMKNSTLGVASSLPYLKGGDMGESVLASRAQGSSRIGGMGVINIIASIGKFIGFIADAFKSARTNNPKRVKWLVITGENDKLVSASNFKPQFFNAENGERDNFLVRIIKNVGHHPHAKGSPTQFIVQEEMKSHMDTKKSSEKSKDEEMSRTSFD